MKVLYTIKFGCLCILAIIFGLFGYKKGLDYLKSKI
jgi:hypothetical protein